MMLPSSREDADSASGIPRHPGPPRMTAPRQTRRRRKYTDESGLPGAFEGETVTRRRFMSGAANGAGAIAVAAVTLPALGFALAPVFKSHAASWQEVGPLSRFTD